MTTLASTPSGAPQYVQGAAINATAVQLKWSPPPRRLARGEIIGYRITSRLNQSHADACQDTLCRTTDPCKKSGGTCGDDGACLFESLENSTVCDDGNEDTVGYDVEPRRLCFFLAFCFWLMSFTFLFSQGRLLGRNLYWHSRASNRFFFCTLLYPELCWRNDS